MNTLSLIVIIVLGLLSLALLAVNYESGKAKGSIKNIAQIPKNLKEIENTKNKTHESIEKTCNYVVIVRNNSTFKEEAIRFAMARKAKLLTYVNDISEVLGVLRKIKPKYAAIFVEPTYLTPDFMENLDMILRKIDDDPYLDVAYGIITARSVDKLRDYVTRLIEYKPKDALTIYAVGTKNLTYLEKYGIKVKFHCLTNCGGVLCVCDDRHRATAERIVKNIKDADVFIISAHGKPSSISLDNGEKIVGSQDGLYIIDSSGKKRPLRLNATLVIAQACLTARIKGKPKIIDERFHMHPVEGRVNDSIALSFLESGALNYIGSIHEQFADIGMLEVMIRESIVEGVPIGVALKDFKNYLIMTTESFKVSMPGAPINNDTFTRDHLLLTSRSWFLFGDPSITLSYQKKDYEDCIVNFTEKKIGNKWKIYVKIQFQKNGRLLSNFVHIGKIAYEGDGRWGVWGGDVCIVKINHTGNIKITPLFGVKERCLRYSRYPACIFYQDLGDEILLMIPYYALERGLEGKMALSIEVEE